MKHRMSLLMFLVILGRAVGDERQAEPKDWQRLHQTIKPTKTEERWLQIPWRTQLWEARREAAAAGKPILLWEMDGHPLGCT
jgi:hypothetical protein